MRLLERVTIGAGLLLVAITLAYRYVLTDEQREGFEEAADVVRTATREVSDSVTPLVSEGPTRSEEEALSAASRARTAAQWAALGY